VVVDGAQWPASVQQADELLAAKYGALAQQQQQQLEELEAVQGGLLGRQAPVPGTVHSVATVVAACVRFGRGAGGPMHKLRTLSLLGGGRGLWGVLLRPRLEQTGCRRRVGSSRRRQQQRRGGVGGAGAGRRAAAAAAAARGPAGGRADGGPLPEVRRCCSWCQGGGPCCCCVCRCCTCFWPCCCPAPLPPSLLFPPGFPPRQPLPRSPALTVPLLPLLLPCHHPGTRGWGCRSTSST
jgi:hypothetical protein